MTKSDKLKIEHQLKTARHTTGSYLATTNAIKSIKKNILKIKVDILKT